MGHTSELGLARYVVALFGVDVLLVPTAEA
jgi:hypothetical protein